MRNQWDEAEDECDESDGVDRVKVYLKMDSDGVVNISEDAVPVEWVA